MHAREMLRSHSEAHGPVNEAWIRCIEQCFDCGQTCTSCADASVAEEMVQRLRRSIRLCLDCADICLATGTMASRITDDNAEVMHRTLEACITTCGICATECEKHAAHHEHHRICAEVCRSCEAACREALQSMTMRSAA